MGWWTLKGKRRDDAPDSLQRGKELLFVRDVDSAISALDQAVKSAPNDPLPLAYRSLARRIGRNVRGALRDADEAILIDESCGEAHISRAWVFLDEVEVDISEALLSFNRAEKAKMNDFDGEILYLNSFLVFFDVVRNAQETSDGVNIRLTAEWPLTRAANYLMDGHHESALMFFKEAYDAGMEGIATIGVALASYRLGEIDFAIESLELLQMQGVGSPRVKLAIQRIYEGIGRW